MLGFPEPEWEKLPIKKQDSLGNVGQNCPFSCLRLWLSSQWLICSISSHVAMLSPKKKTSPSLYPVFARHWWVYKYVGFSNFCCLRKWLILNVQFHDQLSWSKQLPQPSQYGPALGPLLSTLRGHFCWGLFPPASEVPHFVVWNMGAVRTWPQNATSWSTWEKLFYIPQRQNLPKNQPINHQTYQNPSHLSPHQPTSSFFSHHWCSNVGFRSPAKAFEPVRLRLRWCEASLVN